MSTLLSIKDILIRQNPIGNGHEPKKRNAAHEFQAYAYKLATDLNDREHLFIYMRLAKTVERNILEQAYSFVSDANTEEKGKLFLWKLKQIREMQDRQRKLQDFSYENSFKQIRKVRNSMAKKLIEKNDSQYTDGIGVLVEKICSSKDDFENQNIIFLGNDCTHLLQKLFLEGFRVHGLDSSRFTTNEIKVLFNTIRGAKFISKDFFKNTFKQGYYSYIAAHRYWMQIPLDAEEEFLESLLSLLGVEGRILIGIMESNDTSQQWKPIFLKGKEHFYLEKRNNKEEFMQLIGSKKLKIEFEHSYGGVNYYILKK